MTHSFPTRRSSARIGLLQESQVPSAEKDIGLLLRQAMDKVAFLPFGLLIDKWRWNVFNGSVQPSGYNMAWNDLRLEYQGIVPPVPRTEEHFDPGADRKSTRLNSSH